MAESYTREERTLLENALRAGAALQCPVCGAAMTRQDVTPASNVPYVRRRVWLLCSGCRRSASLDAR